MNELPSPTLLPVPSAAPSDGRSTAWQPVALRRNQIEDAIGELLVAPRTSDDFRRVLLVHPRATVGNGLAPGIQVSIEALAPGERATPPRRNSSALALQISGTCAAVVDGRTRTIERRDLYNVPPFALQQYTATGTEPCVRIVYSNAALLETLGAHYVRPADGEAPLAGATTEDAAVQNDGRVQLLGDDSWRLEYERLVDPPWVAFRSWVWRWAEIERELDRMATLDDRYHGRRVCVLYDPATGRTNGATTTLLASMCIRPAGIIDRPHRHTAAAVNYFLDGSGWSTVDGHRIEWDGGDLVFIAPSWAVHHHASDQRDVYQFAVQDNPLHLAMGSLVWQEDLREPVRLLGAEAGFETNRHSVERTPNS